MLVVAVEARTVAWDLISLVFVETAVSKHLWSVVFLCSLEVEHGTHTQSGCRSPMASRVGATWMATARAKGKAGPRSMRSSDVGLRWRRLGSLGASCRADRGHGWTWEDPGDGEKLQTGWDAVCGRTGNRSPSGESPAQYEGPEAVDRSFCSAARRETARYSGAVLQWSGSQGCSCKSIGSDGWRSQGTFWGLACGSCVEVSSDYGRQLLPSAHRRWSASGVDLAGVPYES